MNMTCKQNYELINLDDYIQSGEGGMALTYLSDEERDWWEIESIQDGKMKWTALRIDEDLTTHTETLELSKVQ